MTSCIPFSIDIPQLPTQLFGHLPCLFCNEDYPWLAKCLWAAASTIQKVPLIDLMYLWKHCFAGWIVEYEDKKRLCASPAARQGQLLQLLLLCSLGLSFCLVSICIAHRDSFPFKGGLYCWEATNALFLAPFVLASFCKLWWESFLAEPAG